MIRIIDLSPERRNAQVNTIINIPVKETPDRHRNHQDSLDCVAIVDPPLPFIQLADRTIWGFDENMKIGLYGNRTQFSNIQLGSSAMNNRYYYTNI